MAEHAHSVSSVANGATVPILSLTESILTIRRQIDSRRVPYLRRNRSCPHAEVGPRRWRRRRLRQAEIADVARMYAAGELISVIAGKYDLSEDDVRDLANADRVTRGELQGTSPCAA